MPSDARWHYKAAHFLTCKSISLQLPALQKNIMTNTANSSHCAFSEETATFLWKNSPLLELGAKCVKRMGKLELESLKNTQEHRQIALTSPISQMRCRLREAFDGERSMNKKIIISARGKETPRREWEKSREGGRENCCGTECAQKSLRGRGVLRSLRAGAAQNPSTEWTGIENIGGRYDGMKRDHKPEDARMHRASILGTMTNVIIHLMNPRKRDRNSLEMKLWQA